MITTKEELDQALSAHPEGVKETEFVYALRDYIDCLIIQRKAYWSRDQGEWFLKLFRAD